MWGQPPSAVRRPRIIGPLVALLTFQHLSGFFGPAFFGNNPRPTLPRRIMPHMLRVSTDEICHPVIFFVLMETYDLPFHRRYVRLTS
jgi:hypothetical protein